MDDVKRGIIALVFSLIPYLLVSWGYAEFTNGGPSVFWATFGVLLGARAFFGVIEGVGGIFAWRLHGKKIAVDRFLRWLRANNFPKRYSEHDDFLNYLDRVENDEASPAALKRAAKEMYSMLAMFEDIGILAGARMHSASEIALEKYSRSDAREAKLGKIANAKSESSKDRS